MFLSEREAKSVIDAWLCDMQMHFKDKNKDKEAYLMYMTLEQKLCEFCIKNDVKYYTEE